MDGASALLAGLWIWSQMRFPVGEVGIRKLATIALLTAMGMAMLLTPALLLRGTLGWQVAQAMPADEFKNHWALHEKHDFWCCSARFTPTDV